MDAEERQLSDRERTVLLLAAEGLTDKEIAKHLNLSQRTIGTYWERMRQKLGPFSRTQIVARFLRMEAELERSNENYRNVFAGWDEGVWILSSSGKTIYANLPVANLLNATLDQLLHADGVAMLEGVLGKETASFLASAAKGAALHEVQVALPDGGTRWLRLRGSPVSDRRGQTTATVVIVQDHTFQKRVRQTLDSCRTSLQFLAENCTDPVVRLSADLICLSVNAAFCELHGVRCERIVGKSIQDLDAFEPKLLWSATVLKVLSDGKPSTISLEVQGRRLETHLVPEPSEELQPASVLCITPKNQ